MNSPQLLVGCPPIWSDINAELKEYIECPERLPIHQLENAQCYWPRKVDVLSLLEFDLAPIGTTLKFDRDLVTGKIGEIQEISLQSAGETARNSMSMTRAPAPRADGVRGNPSNIPYWPGGFDEPKLHETVIENDIDFEKNLRTLAKGFSSGVEFKSDNCTPVSCRKNGAESSTFPKSKESKANNDTNINLMAVIHEEEKLLSLWSSGEQKKKETVQVPNNDVPLIDDISVLPDETSIPVLKISETRSELARTDWAEQLDTSAPITDFDKRIPDPAIRFEYELDTFQKQAILKLEENSNVFVAAHTSAGKTTVAEYAIALSQKHMTRVIYTSPIKALSNQKYRDFKRKFESVGLLTGDSQINQNASCLIMTTEILQSMLYCASDVLRDLEFVIFDEVHYINNEDRGHVWEEIVILLPQTINIVMLSATVPNPIIFADWVGRIKKKKMYVISTVKRPIPLLHYLYTGTDGKTRDDKFLVLDSSGQFLLDGWYKATNASDKKKDKTPKNGPKRKIQMTPKQEEVLWRAFISHLQKNDMLPVVVFTLSRRRCDMNAATLRNLDLTTAREKHQVHAFFQTNIRHLKGTDRELPQVLMMQDLLEKGVGIHHSGILPILREIVEMLFQNGVVKLLFATETFAMGVNMPARTVVFDSIRKYDGSNFRTLYPTEYIQMAGRAGRRGHDTTGTVIVMCRNDVPHFNDLKPMMCGEPQTLESKFKITYSMLLNLRRVNESVTVEAMMRKSFKESPLASQEATYNNELRKIERELSSLPALTEMQKKLSTFYQVAVDYLEDIKYLSPYMYESKKTTKALHEGRILLTSYRNHYNKLAMLLQVVQQKNSKQYKVLILKDAGNGETSEADFKNLQAHEKWCEVVGLTKKKIYVPGDNPSHEVLTLSAWHILKITNYQIKIDCSLILKDWEKRQITRFKNDLPGHTCQTAIQHLISLSLVAATDEALHSYIEPSARDDLQLRIQHRNKLKAKLDDMKCTEIPNFVEQFRPVFERNQLEDKKRQLQLKLSNEGMALYPDYLNMVALLKQLKYIDNDERVALKGRVALQMGSNELLITELILKNVLTVLQPAEIAALLSALIFQQRTDVEPKLTPSLANGCKIMSEVYAELDNLEQYYKLATLSPLNFGLVEVVYEWAQAKSFAEIMKITDVQEGIIVRCIQQLGETLCDVKNAAVTIGDPVLKEKMEEASTAIKRDIVFAASLYTQD